MEEIDPCYFLIFLIWWGTKSYKLMFFLIFYLYLYLWLLVFYLQTRIFWGSGVCFEPCWVHEDDPPQSSHSSSGWVAEIQLVDYSQLTIIASSLIKIHNINKYWLLAFAQPWTNPEPGLFYCHWLIKWEFKDFLAWVTLMG